MIENQAWRGRETSHSGADQILSSALGPSSSTWATWICTHETVDSDLSNSVGCLGHLGNEIALLSVAFTKSVMDTTLPTLSFSRFPLLLMLCEKEKSICLSILFIPCIILNVSIMSPQVPLF